MLTSTSVIPVSSVPPAQTSPAVLPLVPEAAPVSLIGDIVEKITPPLEFRAWLEKLQTYSHAARNAEPAEPQPAADASPAPAEPRAVAEAAPVPGDADAKAGDAASGDAAAQAPEDRKARAG